MLPQIHVLFIHIILHYFEWSSVAATVSPLIILSRNSVLICFRPVELRDEIVFERVVIENGKDESEDYHDSFFEASNIAKPI